MYLLVSTFLELQIWRIDVEMLHRPTNEVGALLLQVTISGKLTAG